MSEAGSQPRRRGLKEHGMSEDSRASREESTSVRYCDYQRCSQTMGCSEWFTLEKVCPGWAGGFKVPRVDCCEVRGWQGRRGMVYTVSLVAIGLWENAEGNSCPPPSSPAGRTSKGVAACSRVRGRRPCVWTEFLPPKVMSALNPNSWCGCVWRWGLWGGKYG